MSRVGYTVAKGEGRSVKMVGGGSSGAAGSPLPNTHLPDLVLFVVTMHRAGRTALRGWVGLCGQEWIGGAKLERQQAGPHLKAEEDSMLLAAGMRRGEERTR